ncbi:hypothetical protein [Pseudoduganella umbonata]|uniref:Uncharacterized protein n=1 Tax=Pseudoduganella umbonata TaxID=864828 RepID=A0A4V1EDV3_9BURK|nr:hypothetical protein [Pseudoduganella umbonata]MBB3222145.1 hypothetical protein [Pseudoduganella umbonata]QCP12381.1 hypothetical protein FCL38_19620 [Pseudoduganella umbonata]
MSSKTAQSVKPTVQEVCIDLPGEVVRCWRSSDNIKVVLRKHRDVFFEINLKPGATYTVESRAEFYCSRDKKLLRRSTFQDGERFHVWVGREFKDELSLKQGNSLLGTYKVNQLDSKAYGSDPKIKPEPLLVLMGQKPLFARFECTIKDQFGAGVAHQQLFKPYVDPKLSYLREFGTEYNYQVSPEVPEIKEYVSVTEALPHEIQPQVRKQLDSGVAVAGSPEQIFIAPTREQSPSSLYVALASAATYISGNEHLTANWFKESAGYMQEHWRALNKLSMTVRIEKKVNGKYRVLFKGRPLTRIASQLLGAAANNKVVHQRVPLGAPGSAFVDGGLGRTGKAGYGGVKRVVLTSADNFRGGLKIQIIGTVIDLVGDVNSVYFDQKGSKDFTEFLGRAGVSIAKAGATAAIGSVFAAMAVVGVTAAAAAVGLAAAPVALVVGVVVAGYILAATIVDKADEIFNIKGNVAEWTR